MDCISEVDDVTEKIQNIPGEQNLVEKLSLANANENLDSTTEKKITKLNHKQWRRLLKKARRQVSRQNVARMRDLKEKEEEKRKAEDEHFKVKLEIEVKSKEHAEKEEEINREKQHNEWLLREKLAERRVRRRPEKQCEVGENINGAETQEVKKAKELTKKELLKNEIMKLEKQQALGGKRTYHNPENPPKLYLVDDSKQSLDTESKLEFQYEALFNDPSNCRFYLKTGACRYGQRCSRKHVRCENSSTIMIPNFFQNAGLEIPMLNEMSNDSAIEYDEKEMIREYEEFYDDVIGEFQAAGNVVMFKCCQNYVPHLRGNVYVQFSKPEYAMNAFKMFNGRFYAQRQLSVQLSPVTNWKSSICGLFLNHLCPRGKACNFLHVFRNPRNAYSINDVCNSSQRNSSNNDNSHKNSNTRNADRNKDERNNFPSRLHDRDYNRGRRRHSRTRSHHSRSRSHSRSHSRSRSRSRSRSPRRRRHNRGRRSRSRSRDRSRR